MNSVNEEEEDKRGEQQYIEQVRQGDVASFEPLVRLYQQKLYTYCYYMLGNRQEAEDALQDIFIKAYRGLTAYRHEHTFLAWLYKIAANHCKNLLKRRKRWYSLLPRLRNDGTEKSAEQAFAEAEHGLELLRGLTATEKQILILRALEDMTFEEISRVLDASPSAVRKRFERLRAKVRRKKNEWDGALHGQQYEWE